MVLFFLTRIVFNIPCGNICGYLVCIDIATCKTVPRVKSREITLQNSMKEPFSHASSLQKKANFRKFQLKFFQGVVNLKLFFELSLLYIYFLNSLE